MRILHTCVVVHAHTNYVSFVFFDRFRHHFVQEQCIFA
jgi:hypothetical protein